MKSKHLGMALIIIGVLALLSGMGLHINFCGLIFGVLLLWFGLRVLFTTGRDTPASHLKAFMIPAEGAATARVEINHAMGKLRVERANIGNALVEGHCTEEAEPKAEKAGDEVRVNVGTFENAWTRLFVPWEWNPLDWTLGINPNVPTVLKVQSGLCDISMDLRSLNLTRADLGFGLGSAKVILPAQGQLKSNIETGLSSLKIEIPEGMAARIKIDGLGDSNIDKRRFPKVKDNRYESPDFETAANKIELKIEYGLGSVSVR